MHSYRIVCALVALIIGVAAMAQNNTNSPYTRYGLGELQEPAFGRSQAMGGIGYGIRDHASINPANPASYSAVDSMTFLFDLGVSGLMSHFSDATGGLSTHNGNLDHLAMQMPLSKYIGTSIGIMPYSFAGYNYSIYGSTKFAGNTDTINYRENFLGSGGITQVYGGVAVRLFNHISLGANLIYLFGHNTYTRTVTVEDVSVNSSMTTHSTSEYKKIGVNSFDFRLGAQFFGKVATKGFLTVGAMFEPKMNLNGTYDMLILGLDSTINSPASHYFETPMQFGIGASYTYDNRLTVGADFLHQNWSDVKYFGQTGVLKNRTRVSLGGEYIDNPFGNTYLQRMSFRFGAYVSSSYIDVNGYSPSQKAVTCGIGFPLRSAKSVINTSFEYGIQGKSTETSIRENYFKFTIDLSLNEFWFVKRKL